MKNERKFYWCNHCGNLVEFYENAGINIICCGERMVELKPNMMDATQEKHVPALSCDQNTLKVTVGSIPHPMTEEHYIEWIAVADGNRTTRVQLSVPSAPEAEYYIGEGPITVYAYCNLHGLWAADL